MEIVRGIDIKSTTEYHQIDWRTISSKNTKLEKPIFGPISVFSCPNSKTTFVSKYVLSNFSLYAAVNYCKKSEKINASIFYETQ